MAASIYYDCLIEYGYEGYCPEDAVQACDEIFQALPENDSGGSVSVSPTILHGGAESVSSSITYPSAGGAVSGQFSYILKDNVTICTATIDSTITSATFDQSTCLMSGSAQLTMHFDGIACMGVCGPNTETCPKTLQGIVPFEALLENGELSGRVGGEACEPGCFLFQAGP
jgi:hypothetical protein